MGPAILAASDSRTERRAVEHEASDQPEAVRLDDPEG